METNEKLQLIEQRLMPYLTNKVSFMTEADLQLLGDLYREIYQSRPVLSCAPCKMTYLERLTEWFNKNKPVEGPAIPVPTLEKIPCKTCKKKGNQS